MLVLSQKPGDSFGISNNIVVRVLSVGSKKVRLGIEAPQEVPVVRARAKKKEPRK